MFCVVTVESAMHILMYQLIARLVDAYRTEDKLKGTDPQTFLQNASHKTPPFFKIIWKKIIHMNILF
jgi:hypothetical protein